jgi:hypothetical protein
MEGACAKLFKEKTDCTHIFPKLPTMLKLYYRQWRDSQLIVLAEQQMKREYNSVLIQLAQAQARELNAAVAGQQEIQRSTEQDEYHSLRMSDRPWHPLPVPPATAPAQTAFVKSKPYGAAKRRKCCYQGFCNKWADECKGYRLGRCEVIKCLPVAARPSKDDIIKMQRHIKNKRDSESKKQQWKEKKGMYP